MKIAVRTERLGAEERDEVPLEIGGEDKRTESFSSCSSFEGDFCWRGE